jgi:hypothetical protein
MGQQAVGILYGCEDPNLAHDTDGEYFDDLTEKFNAQSNITWTTPGLRMRVENQGDRKLIGVWVAVGGSGEDGTAYFVERCIPVDQLNAVYSDSIKKAGKLWTRFAKWLFKEHQVELPAAQLWITPCEVA